MSPGVWFWLLYVVSFIFGAANNWPHDPARGYWGVGWSLVLFVLIGLLGWGVFGAPLK